MGLVYPSEAAVHRPFEFAGLFLAEGRRVGRGSHIPAELQPLVVQVDVGLHRGAGIVRRQPRGGQRRETLVLVNRVGQREPDHLARLEP